MSAVVYVQRLRTVFFVEDFFAAKAMNCMVVFRKSIQPNALIDEQTILGEIQWNDGTKETIISPVVGEIEEVNETIDHDRLHSKIQVALKMKPFPVATAIPEPTAPNHSSTPPRRPPADH